MKSVLAVDDSPSVLQMVRAVLTNAGYDVTDAKDGYEGLKIAERKPFDLVVTDLNMPSVDGLTFIRELRRNPTYVGVPIIFLTTESDASMKQEAKNIGATGWMTKPFDAQKLIGVVKKLIGN